MHKPPVFSSWFFTFGCLYAGVIGISVRSWRPVGLMVAFAAAAVRCPILLKDFGWFGVAAGAAVVHAGIATSLRYSVRHIRVPKSQRLAPLPGVCAECGYDLAGIATDVCPECGHRGDATRAEEATP